MHVGDKMSVSDRDGRIESEECDNSATPKLKRVVKDATDTQTFYTSAMKYREQDKRAHKQASRTSSPDSNDELPPVFNKRLFASQGAVVLTPEARRIMRKNSMVKADKIPKFMSKSELLAMRAVVEGLKLIHKGKDYVKDCLSHVITYECYGPWAYITKKAHEDCISCYYIVNGAVEVTYGINVTESKNVYQPNIIYNHGSGEYLGLVSPEGRQDDLAPPVTIYTKETSEFLRIDRTKFHKMVSKLLQKEDEEKRRYLDSGLSVLSMMPREAVEKVLPKLLKQEYPANRTILSQDDTSEYFYVILSGRCNAYRQVYVPETDKDVNFFMAQLTTGSIFAEECVLERIPSICRVVTTCHTVCYKMHRSGLEIMSKEYLTNILLAHRNQYASDSELQEKGYSSSIWNQYKYREVRSSLQEGRRPHLLSTNRGDQIQCRPPTNRELRRENMYRFVLKGSGMQPVRVRSAVNRTASRMSLPIRSKSAMDPMIETDENSSDPDSDSSDLDSLPESLPMPARERRSSRLLVPAVARVLEKHHKTIAEAKEKKWAARRREIDKVGAANSAELYKFLQENTELTKQFKNAWIDDMERETIERNFMDNGVLVSMDSDDIVRKAKAIADNFADKVKPKKTTSTLAKGEDWETILHTENKQAKVFIAVSKYRTETLRKKITELQRKRTKDRGRERLPSKTNIEEEAKEFKLDKGFILDQIVGADSIDETHDSMDQSPSQSAAGVLMVGQAVQRFKRNARLQQSRRTIGKSFEKIVRENGPEMIPEEDEIPEATKRRPSSAQASVREWRQGQSCR